MINHPGQLRRICVAFLYIVLAAPFSINILFINSARADAFETLTIANDEQDLGRHVWYFEDPAGMLVYDDLLMKVSDKSWRMNSTNVPAFGYTDSAYWFRIKLKNPKNQPQNRVLEIAYPMLDDIGLYITHSNGLTNRFHSGDKEPFTLRSIKHRHFVFTIEFDALETLELYLRVQTSSALQVPLTLWGERDFWTSGQKDLGLQGIYFGIMLVMVLYNLFIYSSVRDSAYLYYVLFIASFSIFQLTFHGLAYQYLWNIYPLFNEKVLMFSISASIAFVLGFVMKVLRFRESHPGFHGWTLVLAILAVGNAIATPALSYQSSIYASIVLSIIGSFVCLLAGIIRWYEGYTPARYYTIAWFSLLIGTLVFSLSKFGLLPRNFFTENAIQIGSALDAILLSFALADRINVARKEKDNAQEQMVSILKRYRSLYESIIEGIFQIMPDGRPISVNRAMAEMFGFKDSEEFILHNTGSLNSCFAEARDAQEFYRRLRESGEVIGYECPGRRYGDDSQFWGCWSGHAVYNQDHELLHYEGSLVDISMRMEKEQAEQDKEAADAASRAKSQFLATMSHEIRTPMNGMLGMIELLLTTPLNDKQAGYAQTARRSGEQLLGVINDILDFSKIEVDKLELEKTEFDLALLLEDLRSLYQVQADGKGIALAIDYPPIDSNYLLLGDSFRLRQVLSNLLSNAIKFTEQGSVVLYVFNHEETEQDILLTFIVEDTGVGIAAKAQENIFEAFSQADGSTTRKYGGTGLGLAICKRLVDLMGGDISLQSQPDEGTRFRFSIRLEKILRHEEQIEIESASSGRLASFPETGVPMTSAEKIAQHSYERILLVEDNATNQALAVAMLENLELEVDVVNNGIEALDAFEQNTYRVILMDCQMPEMDGFAATEEIRRLEKIQKAEPVRIIALTANAFASDKERCLAVGMDDYLAKPFTLDQLAKVLALYLKPDAAAEEENSAAVKIGIA